MKLHQILLYVGIIVTTGAAGLFVGIAYGSSHRMQGAGPCSFMAKMENGICTCHLMADTGCYGDERLISFLRDDSFGRNCWCGRRDEMSVAGEFWKRE